MRCPLSLVLVEKHKYNRFDHFRFGRIFNWCYRSHIHIRWNWCMLAYACMLMLCSYKKPEILISTVLNWKYRTMRVVYTLHNVHICYSRKTIPIGFWGVSFQFLDDISQSGLVLLVMAGKPHSSCFSRWENFAHLWICHKLRKRYDTLKYLFTNYSNYFGNNR